MSESTMVPRSIATVILLCLCAYFLYKSLLCLSSTNSPNSVQVQFIQNYIRLKNDTFNVADSVQVFPLSKVGKVRERKIHFYVPKYMLELYEKSRNESMLWDDHPDVVKSIIPMNAESFQRSNDFSLEFEKSHLLVFDIPSSNYDEIFHSAELRILTLVQIHPNSVFGIERIIHVSFYDYITQNIKHLDQQHVYHMNNTWVSFNLTAAIRHLFSYQKSQQLRVVVTIKTLHPSSKRHFRELFDISLLSDEQATSSATEHNYPLLLLSYTISAHTGKESSSRAKRHVEEEYEEETNQVWNSAQMKRYRRLRNTCRKQSLYVNFADINYDTWIVQPTGYDAYQCTGKCFYPVADHLSPTKHAIIQALMHSVDARSAPRTCCVPTKLGSISVLYIDSRGILTYRYGYEDMVVLECGCR